MKDEEIDSLLTKAASARYVLKPETLQRVANSIKLSLRPVRPLPPAWMLTCGLVGISAIVSLAGATRAGFFGFEKMDFEQRSIIFSALLILAWVAGSGFVQEMIPASRRHISPPAMLGLGILTLTGVFALLFRDYRTDHFVSVGVVCLLTGLLHSIPAALLSWLVLRRGFALNSISAGFAAGILGGLAGVGLLELHCPNFEAPHILVWHTAVVPLSGALGALIGWALRHWAGSGSQVPRDPR